MRAWTTYHMAALSIARQAIAQQSAERGIDVSRDWLDVHCLADDQTLLRSIPTKLATIQPPPLPAINGVAGSGFHSPRSRILDKTSAAGTGGKQ
jgi:hypothetical protein